MEGFHDGDSFGDGSNRQPWLVAVGAGGQGVAVLVEGAFERLAVDYVVRLS